MAWWKALGENSNEYSCIVAYSIIIMNTIYFTPQRARHSMP